ncbi:hypothetical protein QOZ80_5AG0378760 [Eleusine coracana subsp. coracana]|nr:hypothetical protein QOZ80_5AG0378760 [Eleusine coracana subsp. coracana]
MGPPSAVLLLHLRRLDRFLKRQGFHRTAHTLERESLVHFDAAHLQNLVREGRWSAAWRYLGSFSPLWEPKGEGTNLQYTALMHSFGHYSTLAFLACRGDEGGRAARCHYPRPSELAHPSEEEFRTKFRDVIERHDLYRSMASAEARASVDWDNIKLTTLDKIQELLRLRPDLDCSLWMRSLQHAPTPSQIIPLGLWRSRRHPRKRTEQKPARQVAHFILQKRLSSIQGTNHSGDSDTTVAAGISGGDGRFGSEAEDEASKSKKPKMNAMPETDTDASTRLSG